MPGFTYNRRYLHLSVLGLVAIAFLVTLTSPISNILMGLLFFALALFFLVSLSYLILSFGGRSASRRAKLRLILISTFVIMGTMLLSVQSLNWASGFTLVLLAVGMLFYTSRRS